MRWMDGQRDKGWTDGRINRCDGWIDVEVVGTQSSSCYISCYIAMMDDMVMMMIPYDYDSTH